jgi:hypothetical protein
VQIDLGRNPEGKSTVGEPRSRMENYIKMDLREIRWVWTGFIALTIGISGEHGKEVSGSIKCWEFLAAVDF